MPDVLSANTNCSAFTVSCTNTTGLWGSCSSPQLRDVACNTPAPYVCSYGERWRVREGGALVVPRQVCAHGVHPLTQMFGMHSDKRQIITDLPNCRVYSCTAASLTDRLLVCACRFR